MSAVFVQLLGSGPKTRAWLLTKLKIDVRGCYRDFEKRHAFGVPTEFHAGRYVHQPSRSTPRLARLLDPGLSVREALVAVQGPNVGPQEIAAANRRAAGTAALIHFFAEKQVERPAVAAIHDDHGNLISWLSNCAKINMTDFRASWPLL